ncbi:MAG: hypothetical protein JSS83_23720 [Cyanobacteria bacterium SZAS LIN-3]|nr:hypothetical protein [Cyanobacteria bacterium SZAS LIN-3]
MPNRRRMDAPLLSILCITASSAGGLYQSIYAAPIAHAADAKSAQAETKSPAPSSEKLITLVQSAKILDPDYPIHITLDKTEASVVTVRHPQATEQDCKIDAVLLAKTIMDAYPKTITRVKLVLSDHNSEAMNELTVTTGDVRAYATGTITKDELLASLEMKKVVNPGGERGAPIDMRTSGVEAVEPGPYRSYRQILAGRIENLKAHGTGTKPFEEMLAKIQEDCRKPAGEVAPDSILNQIKGLYQRLADQEQAIRQAQNIASGKTAFSYGAEDKLSRSFGGGRPDNYLNRLMPLVYKRITQLSKQGIDESADRATLQSIRTMRRQGQNTQAYQALQGLAAKLGMN